MRNAKYCAAVASLLIATTTHAQRPHVPPQSPCHLQKVRLSPDLTSEAARHAYLSTHDTDYRSALSWRAGGIVLAIVGGASGIVLAAVGMTSFKTDGSFDGEGSTGGGAGTEALLVGGMATAVFSIAVGLPIALSAHRRVRAIRSRYPLVDVGMTRDSGKVQLSWRF